MAKPGGSPEHLKPASQRSKEEARRLGAMGGIKSGEVRREKKRMADIYAAVLAKKYEVDGKTVEGSDMIRDVIQAIIARQDSASVSMIKELREGIDGNKLEHSGDLGVTLVKRIVVDGTDDKNA